MDEITDEISRAVGMLLSAGMVVVFYGLAKLFSSDKDNQFSLLRSIATGVIVCATVGIIFASQAGQPSCLDSETDLRGATCNAYDDDGYEASDMDRYSTFAFWFTLTVVPALIGINSAFSDKKQS